jgi:hypothetical protein
VGGLGHYFEQDGLATTQISLVREHTEKIRPPRALWVPFEMGRPLGVPGDAAFQTRVLLAALGLLEAEAGPVLADYPEDAPAAADLTGWTCPVHFPPPPAEGEPEPLLDALERERARLAPWYDLAVGTHGGTTVGSSGLEIEAIPAFITSFLGERPQENPRPEVPLYDQLVFACDDLRAYYLEAVTAQPGQASSAELTTWFWRETTAAEVLIALRSRCLESAEPEMRDVVDRFVPDDVLESLAADPDGA